MWVGRNVIDDGGKARDDSCSLECERETDEMRFHRGRSKVLLLVKKKKIKATQPEGSITGLHGGSWGETQGVCRPQGQWWGGSGPRTLARGPVPRAGWTAWAWARHSGAMFKGDIDELVLTRGR